MDASIIVALIMSVSAIALAIWALLTAKATRKQVLAAETEVKHSEEIRSRKFDTLSKILELLVDYLRNMDNAILLLQFIGDIESEEFQFHLHQMANSHSKIRKFVLENAMYLPDFITNTYSPLGITAMGKLTSFEKSMMLATLKAIRTDTQNIYSHLVTIIKQNYVFQE